jgi:hypothetical protein
MLVVLTIFHSKIKYLKIEQLKEKFIFDYTHQEIMEEQHLL